ncbi:MAG: precorrin-2 C(20)-methyltransferase [Desulfovibrionaceae bacterium]
MSDTGILYGVGVGPGDPELLTLKAVAVLGRADVIFAAASSKNDYSVALTIAGPHVRPGIPVERLDFPMTRDAAVLEAAWEANAVRVADVLRQGRTAVFLTLGDPLLYSTFGYLMRTLARHAPEAAVEVVPGVTSFQAAAARTRTILAESGENLMIVPGVCGEASLENALDAADNAVILKAYKNFGAIRSVLAARGLAGRSVFVSRVGMADEVVATPLDRAPDKPHYLSLVLVKKGE